MLFCRWPGLFYQVTWLAVEGKFNRNKVKIKGGKRGFTFAAMV